MIIANLLNNRFIYTDFFEGEVTIYSQCYRIHNNYVWNLYAHKGHHTKWVIYGKAGEICTTIQNNSVFIKDCYVENKEVKNGRILYSEFLKLIIELNYLYPIFKMYGYLSFADSNRRIKQINFYYNLGCFCKPYLDIPITLRFELRDYVLEDFIKELNNHANEQIWFNIYVTYLLSISL